MNPDILIVVAALDEADRISATLAALAVAFPGAPVWVADDGSTDATPEIARAAGATVVRMSGVIGKGQAMTAGVEAALTSSDFLNVNARVRARARVDVDCEDSSAAFHAAPDVEHDAPHAAGRVHRAATEPASEEEPVVLLCDGDLGESARELAPLVDAIRRGHGDLAVAAFSTRATGGFGLALTFARWAIRRRCGLRTRASLSGQRALPAHVLHDVLPFAPGFGMEIGITIDAARAGHRVVEIDLPLAHRASRRTPAGFAHRARQLGDFVRVYLARR